MPPGEHGKNLVLAFIHFIHCIGEVKIVMIFIASNHYLMLTNFSLKFLHGEQIKIQNLLLTIISLPTKLKYRETQVATHSTYGAVYVSDIVYYIDNIEGKTGSYEKYPCTFNPETGLFSLNLIYYVGAGYFGQGVETFQLDGFKQYDYSITMTNKGNYIDLDKQDNAVIGFVAGTDVDFYRYVFVAEHCLIMK